MSAANRWTRLSGPALIEARSIPEPNSGCWLWLGTKGDNGYGRVKRDGRIQPAHRVSWMAYRGDIPPGTLVCHRCDVPLCVNPDHLWLGTNADNSRDMAAKGRAGALKMKGEKGPNAKLTEDQARRILFGGESRKALAAELGVSISTISMIRCGRNWAYLAEARP